MNYSYQHELPMVYESVINDVVEGCREMFADERIDETILDELKAVWRQRMVESGALPSAAPRATQQAALYMPVQAGQKGHPSMMAASHAASRSSAQHSQVPMTNLQPMMIGQHHHQQQQQQQQQHHQQQQQQQQQHQHRISATHVLSPAAQLATSAIRSQLKPMSDMGGAVGGQGLMQQQPQQNRSVISAVIVPVTTKSSSGDMKTPPVISRRVQLDGRFDGHGQGSSAGSSSAGASGGRGGSSREPPEKKFARGVTGPVSDESDVSDPEIAGLDDFAAVGADDVAVAPGTIGEDEEPLNSGDDVSEAEEDVFDCPDVLVCQYDKVNRAKAKWRFSFRDAILQCDGGRREYLFSRITGEAEFS